VYAYAIALVHVANCRLVREKRGGIVPKHRKAQINPLSLSLWRTSFDSWITCVNNNMAGYVTRLSHMYRPVQEIIARFEDEDGEGEEYSTAVFLYMIFVTSSST
jgi:hypothetical protein